MGTSTGGNIGFIAQEVDQIIPEVVSHDSEYLGLSYGSFAPILAGAIQEQQAQIEVLKAQISSSTGLAVTQPESSQSTIAVTDQDPYFNTLRVAGATTFYGTITVIGEAGFQSKVTFEKEVEFNDHLLVDQDTAGSVVIPQGESSAMISFQKPYEAMPRIVANLQSSGTPVFMPYLIADKSTSSFRIILENPAPSDLYFDWIALASKDIERPAGQVAGVAEAVVPDIIPPVPVTEANPPPETNDEIAAPVIVPEPEIAPPSETIINDLAPVPQVEPVVESLPVSEPAIEPAQLSETSSD